MSLVRSPHGYYVDPDTGLVLRSVGSRDSGGYVRIDRRHANEPAISAHREIWEAVHGPIPDGLMVNHRNGVKSDNRIANLELTTPSGNVVHAYATGLASNAGEQHPSARLTDEDVWTIRDLAAGRVPQKRLAQMFRVSRRQINDIVRRRAWAHLF